jgi:predicted metalloprotease
MQSGAYARRMASPRVAIAFVVAGLTVAACGNPEQGVVASRSDTASESPSPNGTVPNGTTPAESVPTNTDPSNPLEPTKDTTPPPADGGIIDFGDAKPAQPYDNYLNAAFADITQFWTDSFSSIYDGAFEPVAGIYALYPGRTPEPESCQGPVPYEEVQGNAFYTDCGDIIVYDDAELLPDLVEKLGAAAVGVVAAHEYGHAIQARAGVFDLDLPTVNTEQQADCFAGAWAAHVARGESDTLTFDDNDVKGGIIAMIEVRDPPGIDVVADPSGHGSGFDRVGAFQEGFLNGIERCADFIDSPYPRIDLAFLTDADFESGGNMPYADIVVELPKALDTYWVPTLQASGVAFTAPTLVAFAPGSAPSCDGRTAEQLTNAATYCTDTNTIAYDEVFVQDLYNRLGDLSFGYPIAGAYSEAVQVALKSALAGEARVLLNDCLVGAWIIDIVPTGETDANGNQVATNPQQTILLSAGDLDEAVITAVALGDEASNTDVFGTAFQKIDAFRSGVLGGLPACQNRI